MRRTQINVPFDGDFPIGVYMTKYSEKVGHLADELYKKMRVLCWVMTSPYNLERKALHVKYTWSRHCNIVVFISSADNPDFPTVGLGTKEGRDRLYWKTIKAFHYVYEHHFNDADWFLKADDDTYVIVDNLHLPLANHTPEEPVYFGRKFKPVVKQGYMSGGAGYVLSKEALRRFVEAFENNVCIQTTSVEDVQVGRCMEKVGVLAGDSRDSMHRERFHPFPAIQHLTYKFRNRFWYHRFSFYPISEAVDYKYPQGDTCYSMKTLPFYVGFLVGYASVHIFLKQERIKRTLSLQETSPFKGSENKGELEKELETWKKERSALFGLKHAHHAEEDNHLADELYKKVRVLCWVMTNPDNLETRARHVKYTWSRHCNIVIFMSSVDNPDFPTVGLGIEEGRKHLSQKTIKAFHYVYKHHFSDADWFLKADDDTYIIVDNLRLLLANHTSEEPVYFGRRFKPIVKQGYMSGGAGYVLSKEALRRFVEAFENNVCIQTTSVEDVQVGRCMEKVGVLAGDSRDSMHRERFHPFPAIQHLTYKFRNRFWYHRFSFYPISEGPNCCSDMSVSFHYVRTSQMYVMEYYTYHLRAFGYSFRYKPPAPTDFHIEKSSFTVDADMETEPSSQEKEQEEYEEFLAMLYESQDEDLSFENAAAPESKK